MAAKMQTWYVLLMALVAVAVDGRMLAQEGASVCGSQAVKTMKFRSPPMTAQPGEVNNKWFLAEFPAGHVGIKQLHADLVDDNGAVVPLSDLYLHHYVMVEFAVPKSRAQMHVSHLLTHLRANHMCMLPDANDYLGAQSFGPDGAMKIQSLGKGGETRHTAMSLPTPYVVESGKEIEGHETLWLLNVHALDTRGAVDRVGCSECRCKSFNVWVDDDGLPLPEGYVGGLKCCGVDGRRCGVEEGYNGGARIFHLEYTWEYIDWNDCLIPTHNLAIDVTENKVEYTAGSCGDADPTSEACVDTRVATVTSPVEGQLVEFVSHLHAGAIESSIWGEDGRLLCRSTPMYGHRHESHYVVGIQACHPKATKIKEGEKLQYVVKYTKVGGPHSGLMGIGNLRIAMDGVKAAY